MSPPTERELPDSARLASVVAEDANAVIARRVRPMVGLTLVAWSLYTGIGVLLASPALIAINGVGAAAAAAFYVTLPRRPHLARAAAHTLCAVAVTCVFVSSSLSGHTASPSLLYLAAVPVAVGYLLGRREAGLWAGVCVACAAVVGAVGRLHPIPPVFQPTPSLVLFNLFVIIVLVLALVNTAMRMNEQHVRELLTRETTIRDLLTGLQKQKGELLRARDTAIAASRAKSEFVATVSHEIRTPLNGVLGMAGILLDEELSARQRELVGTIRLSGDALLAIINDILDFSKIEAGKLELETAPFDLREHVEDALDLFAAAAAQKGLELTATMTDSTPSRVLGDGARFRQILVNLLGNAIKFTDHGEVAVRLSARPLSESKDGEGVFEIACSVKDTGIGVPADRLATLFVPFSQVDPSTTRRYGGTGLGLAISQRLALAMGGAMSVESVPGEGSTFTFTLRAEPQRSSGEAFSPEHAERRAGVLCALPSTRAMVESLLRSFPMRAAGWATPEEACSSGLGCDVLLVEDGLFDGRVQAAAAAAKAKVVLLTRMAAPVRDSSPPGIARTLAKPVRRGELRRALQAALGGAASPSAPAPSRLPLIGAEIPLRVLVAEDNPINQRVALLLLERLGYRADVAGNGAEAIDALAARPYDLVLMDVRMPEMDGIAATRRLRADLPANRQPRVVAMTANATVDDREACRAAGMDDFLSKPIRPADLIRVLRGSKVAVRAAPEPESPVDPAAFASLREIVDGVPGALHDMVSQYLTTAEDLIGKVAEALDRKEPDAARHAAHSLKGASAQMGARHVAAAALRIEKATAAGDLDAARASLPALRAAQQAAGPLLLAACDEVRPAIPPAAP